MALLYLFPFCFRSLTSLIGKLATAAFRLRNHRPLDARRLDEASAPAGGAVLYQM
jgi:hypothetical protein